MNLASNGFARCLLNRAAPTEKAMQKVAMFIQVFALVVAVQGCAATDGSDDADLESDVSVDDLSNKSSDAALIKHIMKAVGVSNGPGDALGRTPLREEFRDAKLSKAKSCKPIVGEYTFWRKQTNVSSFADPLAEVFQCDATTGLIVFYEKGKTVATRTITPSKPWKRIFP
jgi:hypothetical protein